MAKSRKKPAQPEAPIMPQVGDKVKPGRSEMVYPVTVWDTRPNGFTCDSFR